MARNRGHWRPGASPPSTERAAGRHDLGVGWDPEPSEEGRKLGVVVHKEDLGALVINHHEERARDASGMETECSVFNDSSGIRHSGRRWSLRGRTRCRRLSWTCSGA